MITNNCYEKSVLLGTFVKEVRDIVAEKETVTDILFMPVICGYEVSFKSGGRNVKVTADVKGFFLNKLIIKKFVDGKATALYKAYNKEEISHLIDLILSQ